jgi:hypothetical protein
VKLFLIGRWDVSRRSIGYWMAVIIRSVKCKHTSILWIFLLFCFRSLYFLFSPKSFKIIKSVYNNWDNIIWSRCLLFINYTSKIQPTFISSGCWLILSVYIIMSFDFPFVRLFGVRLFCYYPYFNVACCSAFQIKESFKGQTWRVARRK